KLIPYDKNGKVLKKKSINGFSQNTKANYMGEIERLKVVIYGEKSSIEVTTTIDLSPAVLPKEPTDVQRTRLGHEGNLYDDSTLGDLKELKVEAVNHKNGPASLEVKLHAESPSIRSSWNVYALKNGKVENFTSSSSVYNGKMNLSLHKHKESTPFTGSIDFEAKTGVETFDIKVTKPGTFKTKSGNEISVNFNKNHVLLTYSKMNIDNLTAYDVNGNPLRRETQKSSSKNGLSTVTYVYWGTVNNVKFQTYASEVNHSMLFDLASDVDQKIINTTKAKMKLHQDIVGALKEVRDARKNHSVYYGENLAYLYYTDKSISKEIANSDPLAAKAYGYKVVPTLGYNFTLAEGKIDYADKQVKFTNKYTRKKKMIINGKTIEVEAYSGSYNLPFIVAYPKDKANPTYFMSGNEIFWKVISEDMKYFPQRASDQGWSRIYLK
ncbi:MAG: hypothetical protein NE330_14560, partial [Lentisphaeraceae bacterium]|nr:hypothetical protein [Lentisphaeraceae bacterium]